MKNGSKMVVIGLLSLLVGTAFASPLLIVELDEIRPYNEPLPTGPTADISASVVYANFSVGDTQIHEVFNKNVTELTYFVVLNITNNSDEWAVVNQVNFDAAESITKGGFTSVFGNDWTITSGWEAEGAWVDGVWYNITWVPCSNFGAYESTVTDQQAIADGYWMEGVQIRDTYVGGELTTTCINMNGTWVDVTGRIEVTRREQPEFDGALAVSGVFFSEMKFLVNASVGSNTIVVTSPDGNTTTFVDVEMVTSSITTNVTYGFSNLWAPHESRLIALSTSRRIISTFVEPSRLELIETGQISFRVRVHHRLNGTLGIYDSTSFSDEIKPVQMEQTEDGYVYNIVLSDDQMFVMDSFGVEVFIEQRN